MAAKQIPLGQILAAMDRKDRNFYDNLDDDLKKAFSPFLMLKYNASVDASADIEHYFIAATNEIANKNMFDLAKHPKLQWLLLTAANPGIGKQNHRWLKQKPKPKNTAGPIVKQLMEIFPTMKEDDAVTMATFTTKKDITEYLKERGEK